MDPLAAVLDKFRPEHDREAGDVRRLRTIVERGDPWSRGHALHATASALVVDPVGRQVLLRWHERMQRWLQVGGHADPGETDPWKIALREAHEETLLPDLAPLAHSQDRQPVQVVVVPVPAHGDEPAHEHGDLRYALATSRPDAARGETLDAPVRWLTFDRARGELSEESLLELLDRVEPLLK